jgi:hypothetical protein
MLIHDTAGRDTENTLTLGWAATKLRFDGGFGWLDAYKSETQWHTRHSGNMTYGAGNTIREGRAPGCRSDFTWML